MLSSLSLPLSISFTSSSIVSSSSQIFLAAYNGLFEATNDTPNTRVDSDATRNIVVVGCFLFIGSRVLFITNKLIHYNNFKSFQYKHRNFNFIKILSIIDNFLHLILEIFSIKLKTCNEFYSFFVKNFDSSKIFNAFLEFLVIF